VKIDGYEKSNVVSFGQWEFLIFLPVENWEGNHNSSPAAHNSSHNEEESWATSLSKGHVCQVQKE